MIKVLDIDLDFFLDNIMHMPQNDQRLSPRAFKPWTRTKVRAFLETQCGLSRSLKIPGRFIRNHDAAFDYWRELLANHPTSFPIHVTHVDAHADLGLGDASWVHLMTSVLHKPVGERPNAERGAHKLSLGSYLAYAVACRWVGHIDYVHPEGGGDDMAPWLFRDFTAKSGVIEMRAFSPIDIKRGELSSGMKKHLMSLTPVSIEPPVNFHSVQHNIWKAGHTFDYALLCQSPQYTPRTSDNLISVFTDYINFV